MAATLYCDRCGRKATKDEAGDLKRCLKCGALEFTTRPEWPQGLTYNDRRFLKSLRIAIR